MEGPTRRTTSTAGSARTNQCRGASRHRRLLDRSLIDAHRFRRVYQHFGSPNGYEVLPDAAVFLDKISEVPTSSAFVATRRTGTLHQCCRCWAFTSGSSSSPRRRTPAFEKPDSQIFEDAFRQAQFWLPDLKRDEVLHVGDSLACDFCGARAFGFQALLDRVERESGQAYQDWVQAPDYEGKSAADIENGTVQSLADVVALVEIERGAGAFIRVM